MKSVKPLSDKDYKRIVASMPIATVDAVLVWRGSFLLGKRKNKPAQGEWWIPGGRIMKGESQQQALERKLREETGLSIASSKFIGAFDALFPESAWGVPAHCITLLYVVRPRGIRGLQLDSQHGEFQWFKKIDRGWHPYLKAQLAAAGFKY
jgi:colanic acid biosynthesis protein WcaH